MDVEEPERQVVPKTFAGVAGSCSPETAHAQRERTGHYDHIAAAREGVQFDKCEEDHEALGACYGN